ncbi:MAG: response regulator [Chroococcidiopsidaceae cyanobacterium CP_BM_ER_R8_30]|nr:response regulator [Chroococcidiopsidaceae cyanobacterium CP_BM_ER_R8_30]
MKILLVEDDRRTALTLSEALNAQYYTVDVAENGQIALEFVTSWDYDLILLDLVVPKLDGFSLCRQLRSQGYQKPILLLTVKNSSADVVGGLDAGADDYVIKPYNLSELLARIRALLRRGETNLAPLMLTWEHLCVNPVSAEVTYRGQTLSLTPKEYSLLGLFLRSPQRVFSRSVIIDRLWSIDATPGEGAVTNLIKDLRQKLKAAGMTTDLLETVYGLGYRLKAPPSTQAQVDLSSSEGKGEIKRQASKGKEKRQKDLSSVNKVLERFRETFTERVDLLEQVEQALRVGNLSQNLWQAAEQEVHKLTGILGSFGYETGSNLARAIEHLLDSNKPLESIEVTQLSKLVTELKQELTKSPKPLASLRTESTPVPLVLVISSDASFTQQLQLDAAAWGLRIETVPTLAIALQGMTQDSAGSFPSAQPPDGILLDLTGHGTTRDRVTVLQELRELFPTVPVMVMSERDELNERVVISRLGGRRFLPKPIATTQVFEAISQVLPKSQNAEARVMVVDDDPTMLVALSDLLQPWGLQVIGLQDPKQFWNVLTKTNPDLLVMDLEMPTFSGIDLCQVVRQDPIWGNLPILVVTAHTDMESIQQVFAAGADDFIGKPVVGPELVTRTISRIDRSRLQQQLGEIKQRIGI